MSLAVACPNCAAQFRAQPQHAGRTAKCPKCAQPFRLPGESASDGGANQRAGATAEAPSAAGKPTAASTRPGRAAAADAKKASSGGTAAATEAAKVKPAPAPAAAPAGAKPADRAAAAKQILQSFGEPIGRKRPPASYQLTALVVAVLMVLLPLLYLALIGLVGYGVYYWAISATGLLNVNGGGRSKAFAFMIYLAPILAGATVIVFMIKPLFARPARSTRMRFLKRESEPLLFEFVDRICDSVGSPRPKRIDVDCQVNASASFRRGVLSMFGNDMVLTIGLPLVAGLNARQFAGVLAHEFGHFSQGLGMRLSYLIRALTFWFVRVVHQRDRADEWLESMARTSEGRTDWFVGFVRLMVWLSRRVLAGFMYVGHFFASRLLHQMEYDADRYEVRLAGTEAFVQTVRKLQVMGVASEGAFDDLRAMYAEGRLVDDLPRLMMVRVKQTTPELMKAIDAHIAESRTHWHQTHPGDADRIEAAKREGAAGAFKVELPASLLFADFTAQCKAATWDYYVSLFGKNVDRSQLRPVKDVETRHEEAKQGEAALERFFQGEWHMAATLPLSVLYLEPPDNAKTALAELKDTRAKMEALAPQVRGAAKRIADTRSRAAEAEVLHYWLRCEGKVKKEILKPWGGKEGVDKALKTTAREAEQAVEALAKYSELATQRMFLGLQLALVPQVRARMKAAVDPKTLQNLFDALQTLAEQIDVLAKAVPRHNSMAMIVDAFQAKQGNDAMASMLQDHARWLIAPAKQMRAGFERTNYPFDHAKGTVTLAQFLMTVVPVTDDLGSIFNSLGQALEMAPPLYTRVLGQLVDVAMDAEVACGLPAPAAGPAEDEPRAAK